VIFVPFVALSNGLPPPVWGSEIGIIDIAIDLWNPDTVYLAGAMAPMYKSTDGGASWAPLAVAATHANAVAIDPATQTVYAASTVNGLVRSTDGGASWTTSSVNPTTLQVRNVVSSIFTPGTLYAGTEHGVFKTTDGGATWVGASIGMRNTPVQALAINPLSAAIHIVGTTGVHESRDFGLTWAARSTGLDAIPGPGNILPYCLTPSGCVPPLNDLALDVWQPGTIYVSGGSRSVARTTDGGLHWSGAATGLDGLTALSLGTSAARPGTLYTGTSEGLFKSTDAGVTWMPAGLGGPDHPVNFVRVDPQSPDVVYAVRVTPSRYNFYDLYKSTDGGTTWNLLTGWLMFGLESLAIAPSDPSVLYAALPTSLRRSLDGGATWETLSIPPVSLRAVAVDPWVPTTVYAAGNAHPTALVFKSVDAGATWAPILDGLADALGPASYVNTLAVHPWFPSLLYAGTDTGVAVLVQ
jgi:photosystem II stability/assembly factor-like uncharacterized protein